MKITLTERISYFPSRYLETPCFSSRPAVPVD